MFTSPYSASVATPRPPLTFAQLGEGSRCCAQPFTRADGTRGICTEPYNTRHDHQS